MFELETISDDEIDYFHYLKNLNPDTNIIEYISSFDTINDLVYPVDTSLKVTANIATQPHRFESLLKTLETIDGQFDEIRLYLKNFDYVPSELKKFTTYIGEDLTDNGKFFWSNNDNEYYFTLDDDILYPNDYVEKTLPLIGDRIISYHGRILVGQNRGYYSKHKAYMYYWELPRERKLDVMGTGVSAFNTNFFKPNLWRTPNYKMTDLVISLEAHMCNIPIISPKKSKNWLSFEDLSYARIEGGIGHEMYDRNDILSPWVDMIYILTRSNIDLKEINYSYDKDSIVKICDFINKQTIDNYVLVNIRTGNGSLIDEISKLTNFRSIYSYDTDDKRIKKCNRKYLQNIVQYKDCQLYSEINLQLKDCFVVLDDIKISNKIATQIFKNMKVGSHLICHNLVNNVFPDDKLKLKLEDGKEVDFFYYLKK